MRLFATLIFCLFLIFPFTAIAEIPQAMQADFAPLSGYIIMPVGDEFLIDLDSSSALQEGDILTLIMQGEKVVHPITKEVLGNLELPKGFLQVTRIKSGYSYAKLLFSEIPPAKGDQLKRFEQVPAAFKSTANTTNLREELKSGLPQLNWLPENSSTQPLVTFELQHNVLTVKDPNGTTLKSYQLIDGQLVASARSASANQNFMVDADPAKNKGFLNKTVNSLIDSIGLGSNDKGLPGQVGIIRSQQALQNQGIWMSPNLAGEPTGIIVADLDGDGQLETLVSMRNEIQIHQINQGKLTEEAKIELPPGTEILSADVLDFDHSGNPQIYLTATEDQRLTSRVLAFSNSGYQFVIENIPWFLRVAELPGEGRTLIGQRTGDQHQLFVGKPFRVIRNGDQLEQGEELPYSIHVNLFGILPFTGTSGENLIAYLSQQDYLKVSTEQGLELWESSDYFGGTEAVFYNTLDRDGDLIDPIYVQKRILRGPAGEILVAQNDGLRTMKRFRMFKDSRVVALTWNGFALQENWRTSGQNGYLADFALGDADNDGTDELAMVVKFKHKSLLQEARSAIIIYELN